MLRLKYRQTYMPDRSASLRWHIGDVVTKLRIDKEWNAGELATRAGVSANTITDIEKGRSRGIKKLAVIAKALGTTIEDMHAMVPDKDHPAGEELPVLRKMPRDPRETAPLSRIAAAPRDTLLGDIRGAREALTKAMELLDDALRRAGG